MSLYMTVAYRRFNGNTSRQCIVLAPTPQERPMGHEGVTLIVLIQIDFGKYWVREYDTHTILIGAHFKIALNHKSAPTHRRSVLTVFRT